MTNENELVLYADLQEDCACGIHDWASFCHPFPLNHSCYMLPANILSRTRTWMKTWWALSFMPIEDMKWMCFPVKASELSIYPVYVVVSQQDNILVSTCKKRSSEEIVHLELQVLASCLCHRQSRWFQDWQKHLVVQWRCQIKRRQTEQERIQFMGVQWWSTARTIKRRHNAQERIQFVGVQWWFTTR